MSAVGELDAVLSRQAARLDDVAGLLLRSHGLWEEAACLLTHVLDGTQDSDAVQVLAQLGAISESILRAVRLVAASKERIETYRVSLRGDGGGADTVIPPARQRRTSPAADAQPEPPLPDELEEHIFEGHARPKKITGYHHRPGGFDRGQFRVIDQEMPAGNGVYEGTVEGRTSRGNPVRKSYTTFFPDAWDRDTVRRAVRAAFAERKPVLNDKGVAIPRKWEGAYQGIRIEGFIKPDTEFDQATSSDIATAYPVFPEPGGEGRPQ